MFLLSAVFGEQNYNCSLATQSFWKKSIYIDQIVLSVWTYSDLHLKYLSVFLEASTENQKWIPVLGHKWLNWTQQSCSKAISLDGTKPTKLSVGSQKKLPVGSVCHKRQQCNPIMTHSSKWPGEVMGEGRSGAAVLWCRAAAGFSHGAGSIIPAMLGFKKQTCWLPHISSGAGPWPKRHAQPPAPEAHTPDVAGGNKGQMCELGA